MKEKTYINSENSRVIVEINQMPISDVERVIWTMPSRLSELRNRAAITVKHRDLSWSLDDSIECYLSIFSEKDGDSYHGPAYARRVMGGHEFMPLLYEE